MTPRLDEQLRQPKAREAAQMISSRLGDPDQCTQCSTQALATTLTDYVKGLREAKKSGNLTKEERKELKAEVKFLFKSVKKDIKTIWKD